MANLEPSASERAAIVELVDGRLASAPGFDERSLDELLARVDAEAPQQARELRSIAQATGLAPARLLLLDGGLLAALTGAEVERSLGLYVDGPGGSVLAGAWSLPPEEAAHVELRPRAGGGLVFGLPGSFGLAGIAAAGHAVLANVLRPRALGPGIPGSMLLQRLLDAPRLEQARAAIEATALVDGRNWMLADGRVFFGIEQLGAERILTRVGPKTGHVHANHCFDPSLRQREATPRSPASFRRLELASTIYVQRRPISAAEVLAFFDEVEQAAFAEPAGRAQTLLAIELEGGVAHWRRCASERVQTTRFHTPLAHD
ncbi:MAG TPA: carcinine hydrolase/isopenicillin-N N-acyltransferase family protein [Enhygromyxa sp.]|nr:carcinine hydrolase/isopenicillin-N N-acyltransferase family protein [Enhygromyxa sp.]